MLIITYVYVRIIIYNVYMYMYDKGLHTFLQLLHLGIMHFCAVFVRYGKTLVIDNRVRRR